MRMFSVSNTLQSSSARLKRCKCGSNGWSIFTLPMGEPMALRRKPCLSSSAFSSRTCRSVRSRTLVCRIERSSMWRTPQDFSTSICCCGSGEISSAKALRVNIGKVPYCRDPVELFDTRAWHDLEWDADMHHTVFRDTGVIGHQLSDRITLDR